LAPFYISKTEVTNRRFREFVEAGGYEKQEFWEPLAWKSISKFKNREGGALGPGNWVDGTFKEGTADHPATHVNWYEAMAFAKWRGARLPTEEEWEVAAGWDRSAGAQRAYPWGSSWENDKGRMFVRDKELIMGSVSEPSGDVSPFGCFHMAGNTAEWTQSWWDPVAKNARIVKGTSVFLEAPEVHSRVQARFRCPPLITRVRIVGFRIAQDVKK
jgi:iron(II)-dependent oxidoreductase